MNDILWNLFEVAVNIYEGFLIFYFVCSFLEYNLRNKRNKMIFISGSLGFSALVTVVNTITAFEGLLGLIYPLAVFVFAFSFLDGSLIKKAFISLLAFVCIIMANSIITAAIATVTDNHLESIYTEHKIYRFIMIVIVQITVTYLYQLILKITGKNGVTLKPSEWILILSVLGISIIVFLLLHLVQINNMISDKYIIYLLTAKMGMALINIVCFFMVTKLSKANVTETENRILKQQNEYQKLYAENMQKQYEQIHYIQHDVKQNYNVILMLLKEKNHKKAYSYLQDILKESSNSEFYVNTGNDIVNAVLNSKLTLARKNGINVICSIPNDFSGIEDIDWCSLLGNLLDNAIESCCRCDTETYLDVQIRGDIDKIDITVKNSVGVAKTDADNNLISLKNDTSDHGYGTKIIKNIIKIYKGSYDFYIENNMFYNSMTLYRKNY